MNFVYTIAIEIFFIIVTLSRILFFEKKKNIKLFFLENNWINYGIAVFIIDEGGVIKSKK